MSENLVKRNDCVIWRVNPEDGSIATCIKDKDGLITLRGPEAQVWLALSKPLTVDELKDLVKGESHLEEAIKSLVDNDILGYIREPAEEGNAPISQKHKDRINNLARELASGKNFSKSEDLNLFHKNAIHTTERHFEAKEVTVSHVYREPHPALGNLAYGARLYRKLSALKKIMPQSVVVEVGAGLGYLARAFLDEYKKDNSGADLNYTFSDLTYKFVESQRDLNKGRHIRYCQANAQLMPFKDNSIDLLIDNENIADFTAVKINKKVALDYLNGTIGADGIEDDLVKRSLELIKSCAIDIKDAMPEFIFNLGAMEFIKEIKRVLRPGAMAFVSEYGIMKGYPTAVVLEGHVEYTIQFDHLLKAIRALGLNVEMYSLLDFLEFNKETEVIDMCSLQFLSGLLKEKGIDLPFLAYTREMLEEKSPGLAGSVNNLKFRKIAQGSVCHDLNEFYVLLITKK